jgi:hypothetical protein
VKAMKLHLRNFSWRYVEEHTLRNAYKLLCDSNVA